MSARLMLATDGPEPVTIVEQGHMNHAIRQAIAAGIPPVLAYQMATLTPATYFSLDEEIGGIGPGRRADIAVLTDVRDPTPELVLAAGAVAARDGRTVAAFPEVDWSRFFPPRFRPTMGARAVVVRHPGRRPRRRHRAARRRCRFR